MEWRAECFEEGTAEAGSQRTGDRRTTTPVDLGFDGELGIAALFPAPKHLGLHERDTAISKAGVLDVAHIGQAQRRGRLRQLFDQEIEARNPLLAHVGRTRLEDRIREIEAHDAVDRSAEVEAERLAGGGALHLRDAGRHAVTGRKRAFVELQDEVAAAVFIRHDGARDVEAAVRIGRRNEAARCHEAHPQQAALPLLLGAVAVAVVEHLAEHVGAGKVGIGYDAHRGSRFAREHIARQAAHRLGEVGEFAVADAGTRCEQQDDAAGARGVDADVAPDELSDGRVVRGLGHYTVNARRALDVAETGREPIDERKIRDGSRQIVAYRDLVGHEVAATHFARRGRLGDGDVAEDHRIGRDVIVEELARAGRGVRVEREVQVIGGTRGPRRNGLRRRESRGLHFAVLRRGRHGIGRAARARRDLERRGRSVGLGRDDQRDPVFETGAARHRHGDLEIGAARTARVREVEIELVVTVATRHLALLHRIV